MKRRSLAVRHAVQNAVSRMRRSVLALLATVAVIPTAPAAAQTVDAHYSVDNRARVVHSGSDGKPAEGAVAVSVARTVGLDLLPPSSVAARPGERVAVRHTLTNRGNSTDSVRVSMSIQGAWQTRVLLDVDRDGAPSDGDRAVPSVVVLAPGASMGILVITEVPTDAQEGASILVRLTAHSSIVPTYSKSVDSRVYARTPQGTIQLNKSVNLTAASSGDTLKYEIRWKGLGPDTTGAVVLTDALPVGTRYLAGSLRLNGRALTDAADGDTGEVAGNLVTVRLGPIAPGAEGMVEIWAMAQPGEDDQFAHNIAEARFDNFLVVSEPATSRISPPRLALDMTVAAPAVVRPGTELPFTMYVTNPSDDVTLRNVVVTTLVAPQLSFQRGRPAPHAVTPPEEGPGGGSVSWVIPVLAPGDTALLFLDAVVVAYEPRRIVMQASAAAGDLDLSVEVDVEVEVEVEPPVGALVIEKTASVLDARVSEAVGYTVRLRNQGTATVRGVVIENVLPEGVALQHGSVRTAAGMSRSEAGLRVELPEPLAPGAEYRFSYAVTITDGAPGAVLLARAHARGELGEESDTATALVRVRRGMPLETRVVLARVWLDENGNGRQDQGERAAPEVVVWSATGERVRADSEGRLSFPDLENGWHVFRIDPVTIPAGYAPARGTAMQSVRVDGWSTPALLFPLVRTGPAPSSEAKQEGPVRRELPLPLAGDARLVTPLNGAVSGENQIFIRAQGKPGAPYTLSIDGRVFQEGNLRPDGSEDFVAVPLSAGPHRIELVSLGVAHVVDMHVSGHAYGIRLEDAQAPFRAGVPIRIRGSVVDQWGVGLATQPAINVEARGIRVRTLDADEFSVGLQVQTDARGSFEVSVQSDSTGRAGLALSSGEARYDLELDLLPEIRPLIVVGAGQVGVGAAPEMFGAVLARTSVGDQTTVTVAYDSRRAGSDQDRRFGSSVDRWEEGRYSTLGDRSERDRVAGNSPFSARLERGHNWLALGDVDARGFGDERALTTYARTLRGASGRIGSGPLRLSSFGSRTDQRILQLQLRGNGTSGPYALTGRVIQGSERVYVETRSQADAALVIARRDLMRFVDYDIDYSTGLVLLRQPLLETDLSGNPLFLVVLAEMGGAIEDGLVGGLRTDLRLAGNGRDSLVVGAAWIEDRVDGFAGRMRGADATLKLGGLAVRGEAAHTETPDSAGFAVQGVAGLAMGPLSMNARWLRVGEGFHNPSSPRLVAGVEDLEVRADLRLARMLRTGARYQHQQFRSYGVERTAVGGRIEAGSGSARAALETSLVEDRHERGEIDMWRRGLNGRLTLQPLEPVTGWVETTRPLAGSASGGRPERFGAGVGVDVYRGLRVEAARRLTVMDTLRHDLSSLGMKVELPTGTRIGSELQHTLGDYAAGNSLLLSGGQSLVVGGWHLDGHYSRRVGLDQAEIDDPARALPFPQAEHNRWTAGFGFEYRPASEHGGMTGRGEMFDGVLGKGLRFQMFGDTEIAPGLAMLLRHDVRVEERAVEERDDKSQAFTMSLGLAYRPIGYGWMNVLLKGLVRSDLNPLGAGAQMLDGRDERWIGIAEVVITPSPVQEIGVRYAYRDATLTGGIAGGGSFGSTAHYVGARVRQGIPGPVEVRAHGRALMEARSGVRQFDVAPALALRLSDAVELEGGYRLGTLKDRDFAKEGGQGWYATLGFRVAEDLGRGVARFWQKRSND
jgi:uncharacterized repeat protein (TIGR01451 family)